MLQDDCTVRGIHKLRSHAKTTGPLSHHGQCALLGVKMQAQLSFSFNFFLTF